MDDQDVSLNMYESYPLSMDELLKETAEKDASDLHLAVGASPTIRVNGRFIKLDYPTFTPESLQEILYSIINEQQKNELEGNKELDTSYAIPGVARYRANIMQQRGSLAAVFRVVPFEVPHIDNLGLLPQIKELCYISRGLVLVTGPTGSGKSTTLASMIEFINKERSLNIVTIEDPIEFLHQHNRSIIKQREVGIDTHDFATALRHVLRHDPDVILIGEMRDMETISIALTAAETGHVVFSTLHTQTAPLTVNRIVDVFENHKRNQVRQQLSNTIRGVIYQKLVPMHNKQGRVPAIEFMGDTPAVKNMIREGKEHQLYNAIQTGSAQNMQTMDQALVQLYKEGKITKKTAVDHCVQEEEIERLLKNI